MAIDLFAGAGGLSLGAVTAGVRVHTAIEADRWACATYRHNHPQARLIEADVRTLTDEEIRSLSSPCQLDLLFGGPPCGGFSTTNQRTRRKENPGNWLYKELLRYARLLNPDWIVLENVPGLRETARGFFLEQIHSGLDEIGYRSTLHVLNSCDHGVPQARRRLFVIATNTSRPLPNFDSTQASGEITVADAIGDLPVLENGASENVLAYQAEPQSAYAASLRGNLRECSNHLVTRSAPHVIERFRHVPPGGNWEDIPRTLFGDYSSFSCHTSLYRRLREDRPSRIIGNYRKNLLIHPIQNRGLSVREAARLQSFPDRYEFQGSIGFQQQQVGNAVPPRLAKVVFDQIIAASIGGNL